MTGGAQESAGSAAEPAAARAPDGTARLRDHPTPGAPDGPAAGAAASPAASGEQHTADVDAHRWRALAVCLVALFATLLDVSVTNVALPAIGTSTGAGPATLQWIVSGYVLAFGLVPVLAGRLGDAHGRRMMFTVGTLGFALTSLIVGLSPTAGVLVAARFAQGLFGGLINPQVSGVVQQLFAPHERGRAFGALGAVVGCGTAVGPLVGGLLIALGGPDFGWRLVFFVNVPICLVAAILGLRWLPGPPTDSADHRLDLLGAALLGLATACVLVPTVQYDSVRDPRLFVVVLLAVPLVWALWRRERRLTAADADPLVDLRLFRRPSYGIGVGLALLFFAGYTGLPLVLALYLQDGRGYTPFQSGVTVTSLAIGSVIGSMVAGRLLNRLGRPLVLVAIAVLAAGALAVGLVVRGTPEDVGMLLVLPLLLVGLGSGAFITPNQALSLSAVDPRMGGVAGGVLQMSQRIGSATGQAVLGAVFFATVATGLESGAVPTGAYSRGVWVTVLAMLVFLAAAVLLGVLDLRRARRAGSAES